MGRKRIRQSRVTGPCASGCWRGPRSCSPEGICRHHVREIVAAAGVTKPVLYYYFRNKEGIYLELMQGSLPRWTISSPGRGRIREQ